MKINGIDVDAALKKGEAVLSKEKGLSSEIRYVVELLVLLITLLVSRLNLDSRNSSKPPSSDPNRKKVSRKKGDKKTQFRALRATANRRHHQSSQNSVDLAAKFSSWEASDFKRKNASPGRRSKN